MAEPEGAARQNSASSCLQLLHCGQAAGQCISWNLWCNFLQITSSMVLKRSFPLRDEGWELLASIYLHSQAKPAKHTEEATLRCDSALWGELTRHFYGSWWATACRLRLRV
jgi:hypothetical protein